MRLYLADAPLPAPIDLNAVRLETLLGAVRDTRGRLKRMVSMAPAWFDAEERAQWGFALGEADVALERAVRGAAEETAGAPPLRAYARTLGAVARVARWCVGQSEPWARSEVPAALAFEVLPDIGKRRFRARPAEREPSRPGRSGPLVA